MYQEKIKTDGIYTKRFFNFISKLKVNPQNLIIENFIDKGLPQISSYYTPRRELSDLAVRTLEDIQRDKIAYSRGRTNGDTIPGVVLQSGILEEYPELVMYFRIVLLEMFSVVYAVKYKDSFKQYLSGEAIKKTRNNINFITDIIGFDPRYKDLILSLQAVEVELGYIQAQADKLKGAE